MSSKWGFTVSDLLQSDRVLRVENHRVECSGEELD